jgi:hypothetical protein
MSLVDPMAIVLHALEPAFSRPTWSKVQVLIIGTFLARGRRTVATALCQMGLHEGSQFSLYHHVLSRARWSALDRTGPQSPSASPLGADLCGGGR